jgi:hypothetical protein
MIGDTCSIDPVNRADKTINLYIRDAQLSRNQEQEQW